MTQRFEYEFVRLGESSWGVKQSAMQEYQETIHQHARQGWRLVQIFTPNIGMGSVPTFYELIFERPVQP